MNKAKTATHSLADILPETEFALLPAVKRMVEQDTVHTDGEERDDHSDALESYFDGRMQNWSEAGYTELGRDESGSIRAFVNILRVNAEDLKVVKSLVDYRRKEEFDAAVADIIAEALAYDPELLPALKILSPGEHAKPVGPFYPRKRELDLEAALQMAANQAQMSVRRYVHHAVNMPRAQQADRLTRIDNSVKKLAGLVRVPEWQLNRVADMLIEAGAKDRETLGVRLAYVILASLRASPRFATGTRFFAPSKE